MLSNKNMIFNVSLYLIIILIIIIPFIYIYNFGVSLPVHNDWEIVHIYNENIVKKIPLFEIYKYKNDSHFWLSDFVFLRINKILNFDFKKQMYISELFILLLCILFFYIFFRKNQYQPVILIFMLLLLFNIRNYNIFIYWYFVRVPISVFFGLLSVFFVSKAIYLEKNNLISFLLSTVLFIISSGIYYYIWIFPVTLIIGVFLLYINKKEVFNLKKSVYLFLYFLLNISVLFLINKESFKEFYSMNISVSLLKFIKYIGEAFFNYDSFLLFSIGSFLFFSLAYMILDLLKNKFRKVEEYIFLLFVLHNILVIFLSSLKLSLWKIYLSNNSIISFFSGILICLNLIYFYYKNNKIFFNFIVIMIMIFYPVGINQALNYGKHNIKLKTKYVDMLKHREQYEVDQLKNINNDIMTLNYYIDVLKKNRLYIFK